MAQARKAAVFTGRYSNQTGRLGARKLLRQHKECESFLMTYQEVKNVGKDKPRNSNVSRLFRNMMISSRGTHKAK